MTLYVFLKFLHIVSVIALIGPMTLLPKLISSNSFDLVKFVNKITHSAGWLVFIFGVIATMTQGSKMFLLSWTHISATVFLIIQIVDTYFIFKLKDANSFAIHKVKFKIWTYIKFVSYLFIVFFMVAKI